MAELPAPDPLATSGSRNSEASGYAILQRGQNTDATWVCVKYGPHGGGHGHPDKNSFVLYAHGKILATDAGTHAYGSSLHRDWDKTTLAHNTLIVDEASQSSATGKCLAFGSEQGVDYAITDAGPIYKGVQFTRTVAMLTPQMVLFVDQVEADAPHTLDLAYHQIGEWDPKVKVPVGDSDGSSWTAPAAPGYTHVTQATTRKMGSEGLVLNTKAGDEWRPSITLAGNEPTEIITGYGLLKNTEDRAPILLQRRHAQRAAFVWAISLDGTPLTLRVSEVKDATGKVLPQAEAALVQAGAGKQRWTLVVNPKRISVAAAMPDGVIWRTEAPLSIHQ